MTGSRDTQKPTKSIVNYEPTLFAGKEAKSKLLA
jgi:hypothetical protein